MNENKLPWDDLRTVLAIARAGSLSGARRRLGVSHATVFRRLGQIEQRLGVRLFDRARSGYTATPAGEEVAAAADRIEAEVLGVERRVVDQDLRPSGTVRVTMTDTLLAGLLAPIFADFCAAYPAIALEVAVSNQLFSLTRREADIAIRPSASPPEALVGRRIGRIAMAVHASSPVFAALGDAPDYAATDWVGLDDPVIFPQLDTWMDEQGANARCRYRVDTMLGMQSAARHGIGLAVLPCYLGDGDDRLVRIGNPVPALSTDLWLLIHPDSRRVARNRVFRDFVIHSVHEARHRLDGDAARVS